MMRRFLPIALTLLILLAACFRDASQERDNPTTIPLDEFLDTTEESPIPRTIIPTLTPTPRQEATNTLPVGGPPVEEATEDNLRINLGDSPTLPPTLPIPSFTPRSSNFGDSGITPTPALPTQPVPDSFVTPTSFVNLECVHLVRAGETLFAIATALGTTPEEMIAANAALAANPNALQIGQQLSIPNCVEGQGVVEPQTFGDAPTPNTSPNPTNNAAAASGNTYTVQVGDSLFRIAISNGVTVDELIAANADLTSENSIIFPGQVLIIPKPQ